MEINGAYGVSCREFKESIKRNDNRPVYFRGYNENDETGGMWDFEEQALGIRNIYLNGSYLTFEIKPFPSERVERFNWGKKVISSKELLDRISNIPDDVMITVKSPGHDMVVISSCIPAIVGGHVVYEVLYCTTEYIKK